MSVPPRRHLPERPSLEQLRKQAREHLHTLRAADPSVNLAAAQHASRASTVSRVGRSWCTTLNPCSRPHRMLQPAELKSDQKLMWSQGRGTDVWALIQACASGDLKAVRALIARDPSLARSHYDYRKPLYFAVRENRIDVVRFLLEHDCNPLDLWMDDDPIEIARDRGYTAMEQLLTHTLDTKFNASPQGEPVALALREHDLKQMRELLNAQPALVGKGDKRSSQPIHWATMTRQLDAIDELLRRGADINAQRMDGARPIHVTNGDYFYRGWRDVPRNWPVTPAQVMAHLKARGAFIDLPTACHTGDIDRVRELLRQDPSLANRIGEHEGYYLAAGSPFQMPPQSGAWTSCSCSSITAPTPICRKSSMRPRERRSIRPSPMGTMRSRSSFSSAAPFRIRRSKARATRCGCRRNGAPTSAWSSCSFRTAPGRRRDTRDEDWPTRAHNWLRISPLHEAARKGDVPEAKKLLEAGADLTARDEHLRSTPLAWAAKFGQLEMVKFLLRHGAPKSLPDDPEWATPLAWATKRGHDEIARLLS